LNPSFSGLTIDDPFDVVFLAQSIEPSRALGRRKIHLSGQFRLRHFAVGLHGGEKAEVEFVQGVDLLAPPVRAVSAPAPENCKCGAISNRNLQKRAASA
jgi:hypothetical protein